MEQLDIPILKKFYVLYKDLHTYRSQIAKQDRHTLWQRCESMSLELLELVLLASQRPKATKLPVLETASVKLNVLRFLVRLAKEIKVIDNKKYLSLETAIDEIGRMLGGWIKSVASNSPPNINTIFHPEIEVPRGSQPEVVVAVVVPVVVDVQAVLVEVADVDPVAVRGEVASFHPWALDVVARYTRTSSCISFGSRSYHTITSAARKQELRSLTFSRSIVLQWMNDTLVKLSANMRGQSESACEVKP